MKKNIILFLNPATDPALDKVVHRAICSTGREVEIVRDRGNALRVMKELNCNLILVNYDEEGAITKQFIKEVFDNPDSPSVVLLSQKKEKEHLIDLFSHDRLRNLIARNGQVSEEELIITVEKLLRQDIFGPEKYVTWGVQFVQEKVRDSHEKSKHIEHISEYVRNLKCDARFVRLAEVVADELIMNALYDAPVDDNGKAKYAHLPRTERVQLNDKDEAHLLYGTDGRHFIIGCRDRFGALKAQTVVQYLKKCFVQDDYQIDSKAGGAGVGFYMIFQSLNQLVVNIEPGKMTETIGLIDIRSTYRDNKSRSKSFNIFLKQ